MSTVQFLDYTPADFSSTGDLSQASKARESERKAAYRRLLVEMNAVDDIERRLGIEERWTSAHPDYQAADEYMQNRTFIRAVEKLEGLVAQRLFELAKANLSNTGK